jgi:hypothetical protein
MMLGRVDEAIAAYRSVTDKKHTDDKTPMCVAIADDLSVLRNAGLALASVVDRVLAEVACPEAAR